MRPVAGTAVRHPSDSAASGVRVRRATHRDAAALLALQRRLDQQSSFMLLRPDERADGVGVLAHRLAEQCGFDILALHGEDAVGWAQVERQPWARIRHVGYVVLGVDEDHQGRGLGASLLDAVVAEAASSGMSRLELTVMADNAPAVKLYLRHGFTIEGVRRNAIVRDGRSIDELYMGRLLKTGTQRER